MLKFKDSEGKIVGTLKDEDTQPTFEKIKDTKPEPVKEEDKE